MTARLLLLAHGATPALREARFPAGEALEARALDAIEAVRAGLPGAGRVLASPAPAAVATAKALFGAATVDGELRDWSAGAWAGRTMAEVARSDATGLERWLADPDAAPPGGESLRDLLARMGGWLAGRAGEGGRVLAVAQAAVVRAAVVAALDAPPALFWRIDVPPLAAVRLSHDGRRWAWRAAQAPETGAEA